MLLTIGRIALAVVVLIALRTAVWADGPDDATPTAPGQRALYTEPTGPRPTGILRLLSAMDPVPHPELEVLDPQLPEPPAEGLAPHSALPLSVPPATGWRRPYQPDPGPCEPPVDDWHHWLPLGMDPWGPRTPLEARSKGKGIPLTGTSWLNRPWSASFFAGGIIGGPLINGQVQQLGGFFGGYRLSKDYDYYWGLEGRIAGSEISLLQDTLGNQSGTNAFFAFDGSLLWYPWGDSVWRPYASLGFGVMSVSFYDGPHHYDQPLVGLPFGVGLKYRFNDWYVLRADLLDNFAFASGVVAAQNNVSLTAGVEVHFGGTRRTYYPWSPSRIMR